MAEIYSDSLKNDDGPFIIQLEMRICGTCPTTSLQATTPGRVVYKNSRLSTLLSVKALFENYRTG